MLDQNQKHLPVLIDEVLHYLQPKSGESYLDVTAGYGGHAQEVLQRTKSPKKAVLVDRDAQAIAALNDRLAARGSRIIHQDFLSASKALGDHGEKFDMILADLGVSSPHFESAERGFSLKVSGPLDMRMDQRQKISADDIVNRAKESELSEIFAEYGEEPKARWIAKRIIQKRPIKTTDQLAEIAARAWPRRSRIHPATRVFQALRIAVNDELNQLEQVLPVWLDLLSSDGRIVIISFHSLEDRLVKHFFAENSDEVYEGQLHILTKKPIAAQKSEIVYNPRARSAKLRAAAKIKNRKDLRKTPNAY